MAVKSELWEYFMSHTSSRRSLKGSVQSFIAFTCSVDEELCDVILRRVRALDLSFNEAVGACFDIVNKRVNFPYKVSAKNRGTALHEMGHAVDFVRCETVRTRAGGKGEHETSRHLYLSDSYPLSCGKTLDQILHREMKSNADRIYGELLSRFKLEVLEKLPDGIGDDYLSISERLIKDDEMKRIYRVPRFSPREYIIERERINKLQEQYAAMTLRYDERYNMQKSREKVTGSSEYYSFVDDYSTLLDAIGCFKNVKYLWHFHSTTYLRRSGYLGIEFFANTFSSLATKNEADLANVERLLPESYSAFLELLEHLKAVA